jgi:SAM-dependent methyltransferase
MDDADAFRDEALRQWEGAAAGWEAQRGAFQGVLQPVSIRMIDHVGLQAGHTVLELAAGPGDTGLLAAELVRPGGRVLLTDAAEGMIRAAARRAEELGIDNVETRVMQAEWLDLATASVDAVLCRFGYMLLADPGASLRETRRVLRHGGSLALAAWTAAQDNPWLSAIGASFVELGHAEPPPPGDPGPFAFGEPGRIEALLDEAGFEDVLVETVDLTFRFASTDEHFERQRALGVRLNEQLAGLSPAEHARLRDTLDARLAPWTADDGSLALPGRTWVATASA